MLNPIMSDNTTHGCGASLFWHSSKFSGRGWCLIESATIPLPPICTETKRPPSLWTRFRCVSIQRRMSPVLVVVALEVEQFHLQIGCRPEESPIQMLSPNRANQSFNEGMRKWHVRHRFN